MSKFKRHIRNFIINRPLQTRISSYFVALSIGLIGLMMGFMNLHLEKLRVLLANVPGLPLSIQTEFDLRLTQMTMSALGFLLLAVVSAVIYGIVVSHRIAGPMFAIVNYINRLKAGHFDEQRELRPYDELAPIMESLHQLAAELKNKSGH